MDILTKLEENIRLVVNRYYDSHHLHDNAQVKVFGAGKRLKAKHAKYSSINVIDSLDAEIKTFLVGDRDTYHAVFSQTFNCLEFKTKEDVIQYYYAALVAYLEKSL